MKLSDSRIILQQMESKKATLLEKRNSLQENLNETNQLISNHKVSISYFARFVFIEVRHT